MEGSPPTISNCLPEELLSLTLTYLPPYDQAIAAGISRKWRTQVAQLQNTSPKNIKPLGLENISQARMYASAINHLGQLYVRTDFPTYYSWCYLPSIDGYQLNPLPRPSPIPSPKYLRINLPGQIIIDYFRNERTKIILTKDGQLYSWGGNIYGQLGLGHNKSVTTPTHIALLNNVEIKTVYQSCNNIMALTKKGQLYTWGENYYGPLEPGDHPFINTPTLIELPGNKLIKQVFQYEDSVIILTTEGKLYACGFNGYLLPRFGFHEYIHTPTLIDLPGGTRIKSVYPGPCNTMALTTEGELYGWGINNNGQLGLGHTDLVTSPTHIDLPVGVKIKAVFRDEPSSALPTVDEEYNPTDSTIALTENGELYAWGNNNCGQLGLGDTNQVTSPTRIDLHNDEKIKTVSQNCHNIIAQTENGKLYAWGLNDYGLLGLGYNGSVNTPMLIDLPEDVKIKTVFRDESSAIRTALGDHKSTDSTIALTENGKLYAWGNNNCGQLGLGHTNPVTSPTHIDLPNGVMIETVSQIGNTTIALTTNGDLYGCGYNIDGQLGLGHTTDVNEFTPIEPAPTDRAVIEASANWSFGSILAWTYDLVSFIAQIIARLYQSLFNSVH
jgi:alpha-tubulin suppressor-like RCC1 family protein